MDEKILVPDFSLDKEPTLKSTRAKNERGLCCFHKCDNKLSEKGYYYYVREKNAHNTYFIKDSLGNMFEIK